MATLQELCCRTILSFYREGKGKGGDVNDADGIGDDGRKEGGEKKRRGIVARSFETFSLEGYSSTIGEILFRFISKHSLWSSETLSLFFYYPSPPSASPSLCSIYSGASSQTSSTISSSTSSPRTTSSTSSGSSPNSAFSPLLLAQLSSISIASSSFRRNSISSSATGIVTNSSPRRNSISTGASPPGSGATLRSPFRSPRPYSTSPSPSPRLGAQVQRVHSGFPAFYLSQLILSGCLDVDDDLFFQPFFLSSLAPQLQKLHIGNCPQVTDQGLEGIILSCSQLQTLDISRCIGIEGKTFETLLASSIISPRSISSSVPSVSSPLSSTTTTTATTFDSSSPFSSTQRYLPRLNRLLLSRCSNISPKSLVAMVQYFSTQLQDLDLSGTQANFQVLDGISKHCGDSVKVLKLVGSDKVRNNGLQAIASHCHQIQDLRLGLQYISDEVFTFMATQPISKSFNSFDFIGESNNKCVTDQGLVPFFQSIPKIENISLSYVRCPELLLLLSEAQVGKETNDVLPSKASSLRSLNLHLCKGIEGKPVEELAKACSSLKTLEITYGLTPTSITNFANNCKNTLQSISLPYQHLTEEAQSSVNRLSKLETLRISATGKRERIPLQTLFRDSAFRQFLRTLTLDWLEDLEDDDVETMTSWCGNIEELSLIRCEKLTDQSFKSCSQLSRLKSLSVGHGTNFTDKGFYLLLSSSALPPPIATLELANLPNITGKSISYIASRLFKTLESLKISRMPLLVETDMLYLSNHCHNIQSISVSRFTLSDAALIPLLEANNFNITAVRLTSCSFTDTALFKIAKWCPNLSQLEVDECQSITDEGIIAVSKECRRLSSISMQTCKGLTDRGLIAIAEKCKCLMFLDIFGMTQITSPVVRMIRQKGLLRFMGPSMLHNKM